MSAGPFLRPTAPPVVAGEIGRLWRSFGGDSWATALGDEHPTSDGIGRVQRFLVHRNESELHIVWTEQTGAHLVAAPVSSCWLQHRTELGYPTSEELPTADSAGTFQIFDNGVVVSHRLLGAHEVHGAVYQRYIAVNGTYFGYPTTDEVRTPTASGR